MFQVVKVVCDFAWCGGTFIASCLVSADEAAWNKSIEAKKLAALGAAFCYFAARN
jgi:hypothetical protein